MTRWWLLLSVGSEGSIARRSHKALRVRSASAFIAGFAEVPDRVRSFGRDKTRRAGNFIDPARAGTEGFSFRIRHSVPTTAYSCLLIFYVARGKKLLDALIEAPRVAAVVGRYA